ncbi:MAG: hypothetical protein O2794_02295 [bacterium]|nr:hypothetical protein [bacterium]
MSLIKIQSLLTAAFERIDKTNTVKNTKESNTLYSVVFSCLPKNIKNFTVSYKEGVLIIHSQSSSVKQQIILSQERIKQRAKDLNPSLSISRIIFKN